MSKSSLIFKHEFKNAIKKVGFWIVTLAVPLTTLLGILVVDLVVSSEEEEQYLTIGVVDETGSVTELVDFPNVLFVGFESNLPAKEALLKGEVDEFVVVPFGFLASGEIQRFTQEKEIDTPYQSASAIKTLLTVNLLKTEVESEIILRIVSPITFQVSRLTQDGLEAQDGGQLSNVLIPAVFALLLGLSLMFGALALVNSLAEEKESRLIEVLFSSVSIRQLLVGKVAAVGLAGLIQVLVWLMSAPMLLSLASSKFGGSISDIELPANFLILGVIYFVLGYFLFATLSVTVGGISSGAKEAGNLSLFYILFSFVPLWFSSLMFAFPHSAIWTIFTIFPVTAPVQTMLRLGLTDVPIWEIVASISVMIVSIIAGAYFSARLFKAHMLDPAKRKRNKQ